METIKATTKKGQGYINSYNRSGATSLEECYNNASTAKHRADFQCRLMMKAEDGNSYKIISYNCNFFTVAWKVTEGLRVETAYKSILVKF